jgi:hypothetical protein
MRSSCIEAGRGVKNFSPSLTPPSGYIYQKKDPIQYKNNYYGEFDDDRRRMGRRFLLLFNHKNVNVRTTSQTNGRFLSSFKKASKVYPAGRVDGASTLTITGFITSPPASLNPWLDMIIFVLFCFAGLVCSR